MNVRTIMLIALACLGLGYFGYTQYTASQNQLPDDIAFGNGQIEAVQVDVSTRIGGRVSEVLVGEGDLVEPGQVLAQIDTSQLEAQLARARADVASAESTVAAAAATIAQNEARVVFAEQELDRAKTLRDRGTTTQEQLDTRVSEHLVAVANLESAKANHIAQLRRVDAAAAQVAEIQTQIDDAVLKSTVRGRVLYRLAEPGEVISGGGKVLTIVDLSEVYMEFFLPSSQAHMVSIGSEARIKLDIFDFAAPATVSFVSPQSQFSPRQVEVLDERENLMFRIRASVPEDLVQARINEVKTGIRGVAYVRLGPPTDAPWPAQLALPTELLDLLEAQATGTDGS